VPRLAGARTGIDRDSAAAAARIRWSEFRRSALMKVFGRRSARVFAGPAVRATEIERQYGEKVFGRVTEVVEKHFEIAVGRRLAAMNHAATSRNPGGT